MTNDQDYFSGLPNEMVMKILLLLDYDSMLSARICCVRFDILLTKIFEEKSIFNLNQLLHFQLARDNSEHNWVFKTKKKFKNLCFIEFNFDDANGSDFDEFLKLHGENVITLHLNYCTANENSLNKILDKTVNLKFIKLALRPITHGARIINKLFDRCVEITFSSITEIEKNEIETISTDRKIAIEELNLQYIVCCENDYNILFRDSGVHKLLKLVHQNLKRFELFATNSTGNIFQELSELNLNLETFKIVFNDIIDDRYMLNITNQMKNLQLLNIGGVRVSNGNANIIYDNLHALRSLAFEECDVLDNDGVINVTKLKNLEEFKVIFCPNVSNRGIVNGIAGSANQVLKCLTLIQHFSDDTLIAVVNNLPELTTLVISTFLFFSPHLIPLIYERLPNLTKFSLSSSHSPEEDVYYDNPDDAVKLLPEPIPKNSDIQVYALKNLTTLNMYYPACEIPGGSIQAISKVKYLRELSLNHYNTISKDVIIQLLQSCRWLRTIDFRFCNDLDFSVEDRQKIRNMNPRIRFYYNMETI